MDFPATAFLGSFRPQACGTLYSQDTMTDWMVERTRALPGKTEREKTAAAALFGRLLRSRVISARTSCVRDFGEAEEDRRELFKADGEAPWYRPTLQARMRHYAAVSRAIAQAAFPGDETPPDQLVQVTCTGYEAPTAAQRLAAARGWLDRTRLLHIGHMGCYASIPAVATAAGIAASAAARRGTPWRASLLHIELCTLHLCLEDTAPDQIVIHHLFGDGAIRYDLATAPEALPAGPRLALLDTFETILPGSEEAMTWRLGDAGFRMVLARRVPSALGAALPGIVAAFLGRHGLFRGDVAHFAIHPGGSRILEGIGACLELDEAQLAPSRRVLRERGNMSSATLPHVWNDLVHDPGVKDGELILSLAFGPGLTVTGNLLRKEA